MPSATRRARSAASSRRRTTAARRSTTRCPTQVYQRYLDFLDGQRSYFLASDIADFDAYRLKFDDMIRTGDIDPAYVIFARFQQRNRERIQYALALLQTEPDWTLERDLRVRPQQGAVAGRPGRAWTSCGASASRTTRCR